MKDKKQIRLVCLLVLCAMLTGFLQPAAADVKAERLLKRMENLTQVPNTHLLLAQDPKTFQWGVYDTDANVVVPLEYKTISYLDYAYLSVSGGPRPEAPSEEAAVDDLNCNALMTLDGTLLTAYAYGTFKAYSPLWIAGWVLEKGNAADNDYTPDKTNYYRIVHCDLFFRDADGSLRQVASLSQDEFKDAKAHGEYLSVQNRENGITMYDQDAQIVNIGAKNLTASVYAIKNWAVFNLATGEIILDGCSKVTEVQTEDELLLIATRIDLQGREMNSLITTKGEVIFPMWYASVSSVSMDYAIITSASNGKKGLYSCREKRMILPCMFDDILENKNAMDRFIGHGYIPVMKDGAYYCYEVATRKLISVPDFGTEGKIDHYGPTFFTSNKVEKTTTTKYAAPDGTLKSLYGTISKSRGSGYLLVAQFSYGTSVINWYGNNFLPQYYSNISITDDDRIIVKTKNSGYDLYKIPE